MTRNYLIEEISRLNPLNQVYRLNETCTCPVGSAPIRKVLIP